VKSVYVETQAQEDFIGGMPLAIDPRIIQNHPELARAIAAEHILDAMVRRDHENKLAAKAQAEGKTHGHTAHGHDEGSRHGVDTAAAKTSVMTGYQAVFDIIDTDASGSVSVDEVRNLFASLGAVYDMEECIQKITAMSEDRDKSNISREEFVHLLSGDLVTKVRHY
jgi:hypothetical protein